MNAVTKIGKYLFGIPFIILGFIYLLNAEAMTMMLPVTGSLAWVYLAGLVMLLAGIAVLIAKKDAVATFLLGSMYLLFAFFIHFPEVVDANFEDARMTSLFLKDLIISGAAFVYCRSAAHDRSWRLI